MKTEEIVYYLKHGAILITHKTCRKFKGHLYINYYTSKPQNIAILDDSQVNELFDMNILLEIISVDDNSAAQKFCYNKEE